MIEPSTVEFSTRELGELRQRLLRTRWAAPEPQDSRPGEYGLTLGRLRALVARWVEFDWRAWEKRLNAYPQFRTEIDGQPVHFLHVRSPRDGALPLILSHGWPGSVLEYLELIDRLTDPLAHGGQAGDAFDVVLPRCPATASPVRPGPAAGAPGASPRPGPS